MGATLHTRQVEHRLDTKREELIALSGDLDAFLWEIEEALREARHGEPDVEALQRLDVRAAALLMALDGVRAVLPPRIVDVMQPRLSLFQRSTIQPGEIDLRPGAINVLPDDGRLTPEMIERLTK